MLPRRTLPFFFWRRKWISIISLAAGALTFQHQSYLLLLGSLPTVRYEVLSLKLTPQTIGCSLAPAFFPHIQARRLNKNNWEKASVEILIERMWWSRKRSSFLPLLGERRPWNVRSQSGVKGQNDQQKREIKKREKRKKKAHWSSWPFF